MTRRVRRGAPEEQEPRRARPPVGKDTQGWEQLRQELSPVMTTQP